MPDLRLVGLHELRALINRLNEANLRVSTASVHLDQTGLGEDTGDLGYIKTTIETDILPRCIQLLKRLEGGTLGN